jgi:hypothetical protein
MVLGFSFSRAFVQVQIKEWLDPTLARSDMSTEANTSVERNHSLSPTRAKSFLFFKARRKSRRKHPATGNRARKEHRIGGDKLAKWDKHPSDKVIDHPSRCPSYLIGGRITSAVQVCRSNTGPTCPNDIGTFYAPQESGRIDSGLSPLFSLIR